MRSPYKAAAYILLSVSLLLAIFSFSYNNKNLSFYSFIQGISSLQLSSITEFSKSLDKVFSVFEWFASAPWTEGIGGFAILDWVSNIFRVITIPLQLLAAICEFIVYLFYDIVGVLDFLIKFFYSA